jgi:hypothetical protein
LYDIEHQVVLLPLGGGALINAGVEPQLAEVLRLTSDVFAIVDSEREAEGADPPTSVIEFARVCLELGITCHVLERRAIENYFTDRAVKAAKSGAHRALGAYERLRDVSPSWGKSENWRIAGELTRAELDETDLGAHLSSLADA